MGPDEGKKLPSLIDILFTLQVVHLHPTPSLTSVLVNSAIGLLQLSQCENVTIPTDNVKTYFPHCAALARTLLVRKNSMIWICGVPPNIMGPSFMSAMTKSK